MMVDKIKNLAKLMGFSSRYSPVSSLDQCSFLHDQGFSVWCDKLSLTADRSIVSKRKEFTMINRRCPETDYQINLFLHSD
jgi:hypothetical protein